MAEGTIDLTIVTPERSVVHEQVDELQIPGAEGYLGILPGHAPLFSELKVGEVGYRQGETWFFLSVAWDSLRFNRTRCAFLPKLPNAPTKSISNAPIVPNSVLRSEFQKVETTWTTAALSSPWNAHWSGFRFRAKSPIRPIDMS